MEENKKQPKKGLGITLLVIGIVLLVGGIGMFVSNMFSFSMDMTMPLIGMGMFMTGGILIGVGSSIAFSRGMIEKIRHSSESGGLFSLLGKSAELASKKLEQETLETEAEIAKLKKENGKSGKCPNCGASKSNPDEKCPYCGN